jgi:3',5'-cyclic AMP phosphodiesterase CpdA
MATRIAHISDLHFPAKSPEQVTALSRSIALMAPDIIVVSGDLTRSGTKDEFRQAKEFLEPFAVPKLILPGNHDIPVPGLWARLQGPFRRFEAYFAAIPSCLETPDLVIVGLNTAVGLQPSLDWSLGRVLPRRLEAAVELLNEHRGDRLMVVAGHHPLHQHHLDPVRSRTFRGEEAFGSLTAAGMDLYLHGHLHRAGCRCFPAADKRDICEVCANTALSNRERGGPAGFNIVDVNERRWELTVLGWDGAEYEAGN